MGDVLPKVAEVGLKILFLLIPGIVAYFIVKSIGPRRPRTDFESGLQIFLYGILSCALAGLIEGFWAEMFDDRFLLAGDNPPGRTLISSLLAPDGRPP
jgi:hypothetical protein